jgi:hypothetical protein
MQQGKHNVTPVIQDQNRVGRERRNKEFWIRVIREFEASSLSMKDFCKEHGLALSTFCRQRQKLGFARKRSKTTMKELSKQAPRFLPVYVTSPETPLETTASNSPDTGESLFKEENSKKHSRGLPSKPVRQVDEGAPSNASSLACSGVTIHLNDTITLSIQQDFHEPTLQRLVEVLSSVGSTAC